MDVREIKQRLPIGQVLQHCGLQPDKHSRLLCLLHADKTPSLQIYPKTNTFCCFSSNCRADTGDVIQFIQLKENCTKHEALPKATALAGENAIITSPQPTAKFFSRPIGQMRSPMPLNTLMLFLYRPGGSFTGIWTDANTNEVSWKLERTANIGGRIGGLFRGISAKATNGDTLIGTITWRPSDELWGSYDQANDIRFTAYFKDEPLLVAQARGSRMIHKYAGTPYTSADENVAHAKMFRTGEMYLIRAEARAESGTHTGANSAESDINDLSAARINGYAPVAFASKQEAMDAIELERYRELAYEGHRFWDLKRWGKAVERLASDAPTTNAATLSVGNFRFLLPIPNSELQANPLMEQNPGYN